eukprot:Platyproteum_vivax@DN7431_c0_g1_i2.p1
MQARPFSMHHPRPSRPPGFPPNFSRGNDVSSGSKSGSAPTTKRIPLGHPYPRNMSGSGYWMPPAYRPPLPPPSCPPVSVYQAVVEENRMRQPPPFPLYGGNMDAQLKPDDLVKEGELKDIMKGISKEHCIRILVEAACVHSEIERVITETDLEMSRLRRLIVRNIAFKTSTVSFTNYFRTQGDVTEAVIAKSDQGESRGFGFVTFADAASATRLLHRHLALDGRQLFVRLAADPEELDLDSKLSQRKLFVRNLSMNTTKKSLRASFVKFGLMEECIIVGEIGDETPRYGYVLFKTTHSAQKALVENPKTIDGCMCYINQGSLGTQKLL